MSRTEYDFGTVNHIYLGLQSAMGTLKCNVRA